MKFTISSQQQQHFREHGFLELESIFSDSQMESWHQAVDSVNVYRDLWRENPHLFRLICSKHLASLHAELAKERTLILAYDQLISPEQVPDRATTLREMSCVQGIVGGVILCLDGAEVEDSVFPSVAGHEVFLSPDQVIDFSVLKEESFKYLLIVYAKPQACYILNPGDPMTHKFKEYGYIFGDRLLDHNHPVVYK